MFSGLLSSDEAVFRAEVRQSITDEFGPQWAAISLNMDDSKDVALTNLEGNGALEVAERWADDGKMRRQLQTLLQYLDGPERESVERLLRGSGYGGFQSEDETQDVWNEVAVGPAAVEIEKPRTKERGFDGRATREQTEQAMARLRAEFKRPSARAQPDSGEETESEDEDAHMRTAHFFFGSYVDTPSQLPGPNTASSSPIGKVTNDERVANSTAAQAADLLLHTASMPPLPLTPVGQHCDPVKINSQTPNLPLQDTPGSPFQLLSPAPSTCKRRRTGEDEFSAPSGQNAQDVTTNSNPFELKEKMAPRFVDFRTQLLPMTPSKPTASPEHSQDPTERDRKRRRIANNQETMRHSPGWKVDCVPQDKTTATIQALSSSQALSRSDMEDFMMTCPPGESSRTLVAPLKSQDRQSRTVIRENMAKRLSVIAPKLVKEPYIAKMEPGSDSLFEAPETRGADDDMRFPDELPLSDSQVSTDIEIDMERSRAMAQEFKEKYAQGLKPEEVIPRLGCLESWGSR